MPRIKHMIVLTDGRTEGTGYPSSPAKIVKNASRPRAVAVGDDADLDLMDHVALPAAENSIRSTTRRVIPRIFMKEAMRVPALCSMKSDSLCSRGDTRTRCSADWSGRCRR